MICLHELCRTNSFKAANDDTPQRPAQKAKPRTKKKRVVTVTDTSRASVGDDQSLRTTCNFLRTTCWYLMMCAAIAEGDIGRVFEIIKVSFFCLVIR